MRMDGTMDFWLYISPTVWQQSERSLCRVAAKNRKQTGELKKKRLYRVVDPSQGQGQGRVPQEASGKDFCPLPQVQFLLNGGCYQTWKEVCSPRKVCPMAFSLDLLQSPGYKETLKKLLMPPSKCAHTHTHTPLHKYNGVPEHGEKVWRRNGIT
jgi:hypothetical protein